DNLGTVDRDAAIKRCALVSSPVRLGNGALKVSLDRSSRDYRTDFYLRGMADRFREGETYWYGFSIYFPEDWEPDVLAELCVQWIRPTNQAGSPQLAMYLYEDQYVIRKSWDNGQKPGVRNITSRQLWRGDILPDRGQWIDWVFEIKWSLAEDGFVHAWKNGKQIIDDQGANAYNDGDGKAPYFKFGLYKWPWKESQQQDPSSVTRRILYFDEIRIGDKNSGAGSVSPPE
ncbi:MAG: polysaccharide lyase, partial [Planctomycetia bacterium]